MLIAAILSLLVGIAFASPLLYSNLDVQLFPRVPEGPKAKFSVDIVYADFQAVDYQDTGVFYNEKGQVDRTETYPATDITYTVVLNVTNLSDQPATIYELAFTAAQDISVQQSILGGTIYDRGPIEGFNDPGSQFGGIVDGVYLDGKWTNVTWIPNGYWENDTWIAGPGYPLCLINIMQSEWNGGIISGPLSPDDLLAIDSNHTGSGVIPDLPANASDIGIWFEGVPIAEYYDRSGKPLVTMMYINGAWIDVTSRVTVDKTQPIMVASNMLVNDVLTVAAQPYGNMNATRGPITELPSWSSGTGIGRTYSWLPFSWDIQGFNNTWAPHESRLIMFSNTQTFLFSLGDSRAGLDALQTGKIALYASVSNYINNWPVNGTYYNTVSTATDSKQVELQSTATGSYLYNAVLADGETFQPTQSGIEVTIKPGS